MLVSLSLEFIVLKLNGTISFAVNVSLPSLGEPFALCSTGPLTTKKQSFGVHA